MSLHVGAKMGGAWRRLRVVGERATADGFVLGPSAAARGRILGTRLQLTVDTLYETFEELTMYGGKEYGTDEDGFRVSVRLGVVVPLPSLPPRTDRR